MVLTIVRYVAETAMIAGVDETESTGEVFTVRRGFRLGWSRQAWRLFLTDLTIGLVLMFGILVLLALAASPLLLLLVNVDVVRVIAVGATILLVLPTILFFIVVGIALVVGHAVRPTAGCVGPAGRVGLHPARSEAGEGLAARHRLDVAAAGRHRFCVGHRQNTGSHYTWLHCRLSWAVSRQDWPT